MIDSSILSGGSLALEPFNAYYFVMPNISSTLVNPGNSSVSNVKIRILLVDNRDRRVQGWKGGTTEVVDAFTTTTNSSGQWSANLTPNTDIVPANTAYKIVEVYKDSYRHSYKIVVTSTMTQAYQGLIENLDPLESTALQAHINDTDAHSGTGGNHLDSDHADAFSAIGHLHDNRYFTEAEVTSLLSGKADTAHTHDGSTTTEDIQDASAALFTHANHSNITASYDDVAGQVILSGLAGGNDHLDSDHADAFSALGHVHDNLYYTESETDTLLANKSDIGHTHGGETGTLAVSNNILPPGFYFPEATTLTEMVGVVEVAPVGANIILSIKDDGVEVASITIAAGQTVGTTGPINLAVAADSLLTVDVTQVGSTTPGSNLNVFLVKEGAAGGDHTDADHADAFADIAHTHTHDHDTSYEPVGTVASHENVGQAHGKHSYSIVQTAAGAAIEARPSSTEYPDGYVEYSLFDEPGSTGTPAENLDALPLDKIFRLSETAWSVD